MLLASFNQIKFCFIFSIHLRVMQNRRNMILVLVVVQGGARITRTTLTLFILVGAGVFPPPPKQSDGLLGMKEKSEEAVTILKF